MSKNKEYRLVVVSNEYVAAVSLINFQRDNIEYSDKQEIVTNIEFEAKVLLIKKYILHHPMVDLINKLELIDQKYQTNVNVRYDNYKENFLFSMNEFVSLITYCRSKI